MAAWLNSTPIRIVGGLLTFIGLSGLPDDLLRWLQWISTMSRIAPEVFNTLNGNIGRWLFTILGVGVLLVSYIPQGFYHRFKIKKVQPANVPQSEDEYIDSVIQELRSKPDTYRMFVQLSYGSDGFHPGIRSVWNLVAGKLFYGRENSEPTADEKNEKQSLTWILRKRLAESSITHEPTDQHWYFATGFGKKVQRRYEAKYPSETRRYQG